ncbi:MAG TPA: choice-of-anchor D domain-containing protein [Kofleriaceae bacterium]
MLTLFALARSAHGATVVTLRATPDVLVLHAASGTVSLKNDSATDAAVIASITRDPGCDAEVTATLGTPATVMPGASVNVTVSCAAFTSGMKRCGFHAMPMDTETPLVDFEAVCEAGTSPTLTTTTTMFDFGDVAVGSSATQTFTLTNAGASTVAKLALQTTDLGGTFELGTPCNPDARECDAPIVGIANAGTTQVTVACRPKTTGMHIATLHVASDTTSYLSMPIALACNGIAATGPAFALTGDPVNAGSVEVQSGSSQPRLLHVRNPGTASLSIPSVQILDSGDGAANDWSFTGSCTSFPCPLAAGNELTFALHFDPSTIGTRSAVLVISYNDGALRSRAVPLSGVGLGATLSLFGSLTTLELGAVPLGMTSAPQTFSLYNQGNRDANASLSVDQLVYTLSPPSMLAVPPGPPSDVTVTCTPTGTGNTPGVITTTSSDATLASPIAVAVNCVGTSSALFTTPSAINLGEVRVGSAEQDISIMLRSTGAPLQIVSETLATVDDRLAIVPTVPQPTGTSFTLTVNPVSTLSTGSLTNEIVVTTSTNVTVRIPIRGTVVAPDYVVPAATSLGSFCVNQPTTSDRVALQSVGTGTLTLSAPTLAKDKMSPFDLTLLAPTIYDTPVAPGGAASVVITPKRSNVSGIVTDDLVWTTDLLGKSTQHTTVSASFVADGGAVAPFSLVFPATLIHLDTENAQRVTLQNCETQPITNLKILVPAPFSVDVGTPPPTLAPNETVTFSVGFHPTRVGTFGSMDPSPEAAQDHLFMTVSADQFTPSLTVELFGTGITSPPLPDAGVTPTNVDDSSFYSCDGCSSNAPSSCALALGVLTVALGSRRKRR